MPSQLERVEMGNTTSSNGIFLSTFLVFSMMASAHWELSRMWNRWKVSSGKRAATYRLTVDTSTNFLALCISLSPHIQGSLSVVCYVLCKRDTEKDVDRWNCLISDSNFNFFSRTFLRLPRFWIELHFSFVKLIWGFSDILTCYYHKQ